ncbi:anti-sigma-factor antagonist [Streptomyces sp. 2131.1]|uniref:STAS domain-containing protein n=1 Tax=Streptomyces sp. 2131.1 TaxID=1855346 RepID=UPI00089C10BE|nr:STAS domain-containing protein [Streptomyces sp. 2131.1]SEB68215.1 anti-sigma-factor antagonist [Streptomyces sp. 2131.1]
MSAPSLFLTVESEGGAVCLRLAGVLDYDTSDELAARADACIEQGPRAGELHLDCEKLRLCDSTGLSALLMIHRRTTARGITLFLDNPPPFMERMLSVTGTRHLFAPESGKARQSCPDEVRETTD